MSTLEERALADSDDSDRFVYSDRFITAARGDAITSFVTQTQALVKAQHERDEALATLARARQAQDALAALYAKAAENADVGYRGSEDYADAFGQALDLIRAALGLTL